MSVQSIPIQAKARSHTRNLLLVVLPSVIFGLFGASLFLSFLGDQASEIAKLIGQIEQSCAELYESNDASQLTVQSAGAETLCNTYFSKVVLYYALIAVWCPVSFMVTLYQAGALKSRATRLLIASLVATALPALIMFKYFISGQYARYVIPTQDGVVYGLPLFAVVMVGLVSVQLLVMIIAAVMQKELPTFERAMPVLFWGAVITFVGVSILFAVHPLNLYDLIGTINIVVLYITLLYAFLAGLFYYGQKTGYPMAALFFIYITVVNGIGFNNNYYVDAEPVPEPEIQGDDQFLKWLANRKDLEAYRSKGRPYPVYVIASSGGGMYAAMRTSYLLEFIQSKCPAFMHHTFAVSSVSGGALGALVFSAKQEHEPSADKACVFPEDPAQTVAADGSSIPVSRPKDWREFQSPILDAFYRRDVVSAIVGGGLFPEMLQRVIPFPIHALSRSHAFRKALRENWRLATIEAPPARARAPRKQGGCEPGTLFTTCTIANYWSPERDFPLQIYNATWVDEGVQIVLSNIDAQYYANIGPGAIIHDRNSSLKLLDGASVSARFPIAMPAGIIPTFAGIRELRLVDGAYFDSSGLLAARAVRKEINRIATDKGIAGQVEVHLVYLGEDGDAQRMLGPQAGSQRSAWLEWIDRKGGEIGAHATALLNARNQRSVLAKNLISELMRQSGSDILSLTWQVNNQAQSILEAECANIPLAWYLAPCTQSQLKDRLKDSLFDDAFKKATLQGQLTP